MIDLRAGCYAGVCVAVAMFAGCGGDSGMPPSTVGLTAERAHPSVGYGVLYSFKGGSTDGAQPHSGLIAVKGMLYGTTLFGGSGSCTGDGSGCGVVFAISTSGKETLLYSFQNESGDGQYPDAGLVNVTGTLYGTTYLGGQYADCASGACGTVFSVTTSGKEALLHSFDGKDGGAPLAGLINIKSALYGTTSAGGAYYYCPPLRMRHSFLRHNVWKKSFALQLCR
jgi:uncharacterized repeat protein (TIGR03803 family)